jgi:hypothetical protein
MEATMILWTEVVVGGLLSVAILAQIVSQRIILERQRAVVRRISR